MSQAQLTGTSIKEEAQLLFDQYDTSAVHDVPPHGLRSFGAYTKHKPTIALGLVCPVRMTSKMRSLVQTLNTGSGSKYFHGMGELFSTELSIVETRSIADENDVQEYERSARALAETAGDRIDVFLVYVPKTSRFHGHTPYYRCKAIFASYGYPSQMVTYQTFGNLEWSYLNLASALYSKAGEIPWVLADEMQGVDIFIGISISNLVSEWNVDVQQKRYISYANIFDQHGRWRFYQGTAQLYDRTEQGEQISDVLRGSITKYEAETDKRPFGVNIHSYKRISPDMKRLVIRVLDQLLDDYHVSFVSINDDHPLRAYDKKTSDWSFRRGDILYVHPKRFLLSTTGESEVAGRRMGTPKLLDVTIDQHPESVFERIDFGKQILALTRMNWGTVMPLVREPITISYSRQLAYMVAAVSNQEWERMTEPIVNSRLSKIPWFI